MNEQWSEVTLQQYIADGVQESLVLDYKAAGALWKSDGKKIEITKDVSAFANSAGGIIIYGIRENHQRLPEKIDPVDSTEFSKEWLEQVINSIRPRIESVKIHIVQLASEATHVAYIVEIPQGTTAHQAGDKRYYKRYNFESVAMEDYEIRDVMGRSQLPEIQLNFIVRRIDEVSLRYVRLEIEAKNIGHVYAQYVNCLIFLPSRLASHRPLDFSVRDQKVIDGTVYFRLDKANLRRDVIDEDQRGNQKLGTSWFDPILPSLIRTWRWSLPSNFKRDDFQCDEYIYWEVYADNAPKRQGRIALRDIEFVHNKIKVSETARRVISEIPAPMLILGILGFIASLFIPQILKALSWLVSLFR